MKKKEEEEGKRIAIFYEYFIYSQEIIKLSKKRISFF